MKKIIAIIVFSCPILVSAQGFTANTQGIKQQAMGNAGTSYIQDAATVFYNPAGMTFLKENSFTIGGNYLSVNSIVHDSLTHIITESETKPAYIISAYGVYGFDSTTTLKDLKFGLGVYTPYGSAVKYPNNWVGRFIVEETDLKTLTIQPTASYKIFKNLSLGAGMMITMGSFSKRNDVNLMDSAGNFSTADISGRFIGYGANIGVNYKPIKDLTIGLSYRSPMNAKIKNGDFKMDSLPSTLVDSVPVGNFSTVLPLPQVLSIGIAYQISDKLTITADYNHYSYKTFDTILIDFETNTPSFEDIKEVKNYSNAISAILGVNYDITDALSARVGVRYATSAIPDGYASPDGADGNRFSYSIGAGYKINTKFTVDAFAGFESVERSDRNEELNFYGDYKTNAITSGLSLTFNY